MADDTKLTREQIEEWIHKHLGDFPERDDAWHRSVLNLYETGQAAPVATEPADS